MIVKLLTEHHLEILSLKGGCIRSSESTLVKMPHCWKSHVTAQLKHIIGKREALSLKFSGSLNLSATICYVHLVNELEHTVERYTQGLTSIMAVRLKLG